MKTLIVSTASQSGDVPAGVLVHERPHYSFAYSASSEDQTVSLRMPLRRTPYLGMELPQIFTMNFPEGWLRQQIETRLVREGVVNDMALLQGTGQHQIGRLRFSAPGARSASAQSGVSLEALLKSGRSPALFDSLVEAYFAAGVSGVQPKVLLPDFGQRGAGTFVQPGLIVKAAGAGYPDITRNEFLCMEAARMAGVHVPEFWLSDDDGLFITQRFDRNEQGHVLGFEDMAVLLNAGYDPVGHYKYQGGYEDIAKLVAKTSQDAATDRQRLFEYVALSVLTRNGDAHLKNFGLLYDSPARPDTIRLAPLYDVVSTMAHRQQSPAGMRIITSDRTMALTLRGSKAYPGRDQLLSFGRDDCGISNPEHVLDRLATGLEQAMATHASRFPRAFVRQMEKAWSQGLNGLTRDQVVVPQRPSIHEYRAQQLTKAQNNHAYLLSAFWAASPQLDLVRQAHDLPLVDETPEQRDALEAVWRPGHPAHDSLMAVVGADPRVQAMAVKLGRARKTLDRRLGQNQESGLDEGLEP